MNSKNQGGRPSKPKVNELTRTVIENRLAKNRASQAKAQERGFSRSSVPFEKMLATERRYLEMLDQMAVLEAEQAQAADATREVKTRARDATVATPWGFAREVNGRLIINAPSPAEPEWSAWCNKHEKEFLKPLSVTGYECFIEIK